MTRYGMVLDLNTCTGCRACMAACAMENQTPYWSDKFRTHVEDVTSGTFPNVTRVLAPRLCMQCDNPACVAACPTGASHKTAEGIVAVDQERCIDCKYCMAACPYDARFEYSDVDRTQALTIYAQAPAKSFVDKCNFCEPRVKAGGDPACVATCLAGARIFGDLDNPQSKVALLVASGNAKPIAPEAGTQPKVFYLAANTRTTSAIPANPTSAGLTNVWQGLKGVGSVGLGVATVGVVGVFGYARHNAKKHIAEIEQEAGAAESELKEKTQV